MKLYLMRHAQAASVLEDPARSLTSVGRQEVEAVLSRIPLSARDIVHVVHSGVSRTQETAQIVADYLGIADVTAAPQWLGESASIDTCLQDIPAWEENTLLVSHFPFLNQLINQLVLKNRAHEPVVQFSTATIVCLKKMDNASWIIQWMIAP